MTRRGRLVSPDDAVRVLLRRIDQSWPQLVCDEFHGTEEPFHLALRPNVSSSAAVEPFLADQTWGAWLQRWREIDLDGVAGVGFEQRMVRVVRRDVPAPYQLRIDGLEGSLRVLDVLGGPTPSVDLDRAHRIARGLRGVNATVIPGLLRRVSALTDNDVDTLLEVLRWLDGHPDLSAWTARQLPIPHMHSKWWERRVRLLSALTNRDLARETRPRLSVVHLTYLDPRYRAAHGRRHDAWTGGDRHELPEQPRLVVVVENRDSRLWFPDQADAVAVEGSGKAASALLPAIGWITRAERIVYWGDVDPDGFQILDKLRKSLQPCGVQVESMLMNLDAYHRYGHLGVSHDRDGALLNASDVKAGSLEPAEVACLRQIAAPGPVPFRRIEQERIPSEDVAAALATLLASEANST